MPAAKKKKATASPVGSFPPNGKAEVPAAG